MDKHKKRNGLELKEITPKGMSCGIGACPAIFKSNQGSYFLIGRKVNATEIGPDIINRVGSGETLIEIPETLLASFANTPTITNLDNN